MAEGTPNYETISLPYDSMMQRIDGDLKALSNNSALGETYNLGDPVAERTGASGSTSPAASPSTTTPSVNTPADVKPNAIQGVALGNLWIETWIKSINYAPKSVGFLIDGEKGYIECRDFYSNNATITAGAIGGFTIGSDYIKDTANSFGFASTISGSNDVRIWAGATFENRATAPFRVYEDGEVIATGLDVDHLDIPDTTTANSLHVDTTGLLWAGANVANKDNAPVRLNPTGLMTLGNPSSTYISLDGPNVRMRSSNYVAGVSGFTIEPGLIEAENLVARGIMKGATFQYDVVSAVGGQLMVSNTDVMASDMTAADNSSMVLKGTSTFAVNDILLIKAITASGIQEEWLRITNAASAPTYTVTRDLTSLYSANNNPVWLAGTTVVKMGSSNGTNAYSGGWLRLLGQGTNSPYYSVFARTGVAHDSYAETCRLGNLNGIGNFNSDTYGIFIGNYSSGKFMTYDSVSGNLNVNGYVPFTKGTFGGDGSDGALNISSGTTTIDLGGEMTVVKNYSSISITGTGKLAFINPHANGTYIVLKSKGDVTITSSNAPCVDASGMGGAGGLGNIDGNGSGYTNPGRSSGNNGYSLFYQTVAGGRARGYPWDSDPGNGHAGTLPVFAVQPAVSQVLNRYPHAFVGSGGGGAGGTYWGLGGNGGAGGGGLIIECCGAWNFTTTNGISVAGKNGTDGTAVLYTSQGAGGGGGGSGGFFLCLYNTLTANSGTVNVVGGNKGAIGANGGAWEGGSGASAVNAASGSKGGDGVAIIAKNELFS